MGTRGVEFSVFQPASLKIGICPDLKTPDESIKIVNDNNFVN
jgi:hypothetical protein